MKHQTYTSTQISLAQEIFAYLYLFSEGSSCADAAIGFGHFDLKIPQRCGELYINGYARKIIFTGGIGSGTADLGKAEAVAFREELEQDYPAIPAEAVILETTSTNTSENIQFTARKLAHCYPDFTFDDQIKKAIIVANAYRQRRVWLTCIKNLPQVAFYNMPPPTTFEKELRLFSERGSDFLELLVGEIDRLIRYAEAGYIVHEAIPQKICDNYVALKGGFE
jgi:uncharacterized SAM-binding protein YcdF (DUF218 family)